MFGVNPYSPYGYPDIFGNSMQQNGQFLPTQPQMMQNQQAQQQNGPGWIMAPNVQDVERVSVAPGGKSWIMVQNAPVFALRTADQMGLITTEYYRFEKIDPGSVLAPSAPEKEYVTRQEFEQFVESMKAGKEGAEA